MSMTSSDNPNVKTFLAPDGGRYVSSRSITHLGTVVTVALRWSALSSVQQRPTFEYQILNVAETPSKDTNETKEKARPGDQLDSDCWLFNPLPLTFPNEAREAGVEVAPLQKLATVDSAGKGEKDGVTVNKDSIDVWASTTASWTHQAVKHFELLSDGPYVYLFRQSQSNTLLCDRFTMGAGKLNPTLEVRYQRSGDKCLPLNPKDTLSSRDMNDQAFFEPTLMLSFLGSLCPPSAITSAAQENIDTSAVRDGRFSVLRLPTATNEIYKWQIFLWRQQGKLIESISIDSARGSGLFDLKGRTYYSCGSEQHDPVFSSEGGACNAIIPEGGRECELAKVPVPNQGSSLPNWALSLSDGAFLEALPDTGIPLNPALGFTLEAWLAPSSFKMFPRPKSLLPAIAETSTIVSDSTPAPVAPVPAVVAIREEALQSTPPAVLSCQSESPSDEKVDTVTAHDGDSPPSDFDEDSEDEGFDEDSPPTSVPSEDEDEDDLIDIEDDDENSPAANASTWVPPESSYCIFELDNEISLYIDSEYRLVLRGGKDGKPIFKSTSSVIPDTWTHIALVFNGRSFSVVVDGVEAEFDHSSGEAVHPAPEKPPTALLAIGRESKAGDAGKDGAFRGMVDELRLWTGARPVNTISSGRAVRLSGFEEDLTAYWKLDEGQGMYCYDLKTFSASLLLQGEKASWTLECAPMASGLGVTRQMIRLRGKDGAAPQDRVVDVVTSMSSSIYYEQVQVVSKKAGSGGNTEAKPLKRGGRLLLAFGSSIADLKVESQLTLLDFAITIDGTISDYPPLLNLPLTGLIGQVFPTSILHVDSTGHEIFGSIVKTESGRLRNDESISVVESALGTVSIYYRHYDTCVACVLNYDTSRRLTALAAPAEQSSQHNSLGFGCSSKLRNVRSIEVTAKTCAWLPETLGVDLTIKANCVDGSTRQEVWLGVPRESAKLCAILSEGGIGSTARKAVGRLASLEVLEKATQEADGTTILPDMLELRLAQPLRERLHALSSLFVGPYARFQVLLEAEVGETSIYTSRMYMTIGENAKSILGRVVYAATYDDNLAYLISYNGGPELAATASKTNDFLNKGSCLLSLQAPITADEDQLRAVSSKTETSKGDEPDTRLVQLNITTRIEGDVSEPSMGSGLNNAGVRFSGRNAYSCLNVTTKAAPRVGDYTFECWLRVEKAQESCLVSYRLNAEAGDDPARALTLCTTKDGAGTGEFCFVGGVNGKFFKIQQSQALMEKKWIHMAIAYQQAGALLFDGSNYVDIGQQSDLNLSDFTITFSICFDDVGQSAQILYKASKKTESTPLDLCYKAGQGFVLRFHDDKRELSFVGICTLASKVAYQVTVSRGFKNVARTHKSQKEKGPISIQAVTFRVVSALGQTILEQSFFTDEDARDVGASDDVSNKLNSYANRAKESAAACTNDSNLYLAGAPASCEAMPNCRGRIGDMQIFSSSVKSSGVLPQSKSRIASWRMLDDSIPNVLVDEADRNHGKLVGGPKRVPSPYAPDSSCAIYINGGKALRSWSQSYDALSPSAKPAMEPPLPQQLTFGNYLAGQRSFLFLGARNGFVGEIDEVRLWNVARTRENITDGMYGRLTEDSPDLGAYFPFDRALSSSEPTSTPEQKAKEETENERAVLQDRSINSWHLTSIHSKPLISESQAPISSDAPLVLNTVSIERSGLSLEKVATRFGKGVLQVASRPSTAEYADIQQSLRGDLTGVYKRAYSTITTGGEWQLTTAFKIGSLLTEWVSQVQTNPTLKGFIEGAPPIAAENYVKEGASTPTSAVRFSEARKSTLAYSARGESGTDTNNSSSRTIGGKWDVSLGVGVQTKLTDGHVKATVKESLDVSNSSINNSTSTFMSTNTQEVKVELTGSWRKQDERTGQDHYEANNVGIAWVESETCDLYALRLLVRGRPPPLVAYQLRPNPDIPKDVNLMTFKINDFYCKQGCLDGKRGFEPDESFPGAMTYSSDVSYFKPREAYTLKDRIRRDEKRWADDFARSDIAVGQVAAERMNTLAVTELARKHKRNICNTYVWTAEGGTFQESHSTIDTVQTEVGGQTNVRTNEGHSLDIEANVSALLNNYGVDAMWGTHYTLTKTRDTSSESTFELTTELPGPIDLRRRTNGKWVKRPGAVDAYRWMSFWLEPSTENADYFFRKVVDPIWLASSRDPNAVALAALQADPAEVARQKCWRVMHRVTYVSRVPERLAPPSAGPAVAEEKRLVFDVAGSWQLIQQLEPIAHAATNRTALVTGLRTYLEKRYPAILGSTRTFRCLVDFLQDYCKVPGSA